MGASGRQFLHIRMEESHYEDIPPEYRDVMQITRVEIEGEEYPDDPIWVELKEKAKESYKDYKALMNYQYEKRNN